jgi:hypothetical protein
MIKQYGVDCYGVAVGALGDERGLIVSAVYRRCGSQKTAAGRSPRAEVRIYAPPKVVGDQSYRLMFAAVIMHELGHALGLDHATGKDDLMYTGVDQLPPSYSLPSTLDLYALWLLASGTDQRVVSLPISIPYALPP